MIDLIFVKRMPVEELSEVSDCSRGGAVIFVVELCVLMI